MWERWEVRTKLQLGNLKGGEIGRSRHRREDHIMVDLEVVGLMCARAEFIWLI
jgi:hypothetical protein